MKKNRHNKSVFCTLFLLCWLFSAIVMANEASEDKKANESSQEKKDLPTTLKEFISPGNK